jgi:hypothetical protein
LNEIGMVTGAVWTDADADGDPDLLLARDMGAPELLVNQRDGVLEAAGAGAGLSELTGRWTGIATGDVDGDGDMDAVATNLGLNTRYKASAEQPYVVFAGDIAGKGVVDVIETEWEDGALYPMRGAAELGHPIPLIADRFESFLAFARATVDEVLADLADSVTRYEAATLAHTLLINDGTGTYTAEALPQAAQLTSAYGVVMEDLDADGNVDVYLVGNFNGPEPMHTGPYGGGISVWLRGDGAGGFEAVPVARSGLSVPEDAKGLGVADFDGNGWLDVAVGVNMGHAKLFSNDGIPGNETLTVRLVGPQDNPAGVGATIAVELPDATILTREVQAGSSFLSQNAATQVIGVGSADGRLQVTVLWPDGTEQVLNAEPGDALVVDHGDA